jgi:hypothetical protein
MLIVGAEDLEDTRDIALMNLFLIGIEYLCPEDNAQLSSAVITFGLFRFLQSECFALPQLF